MRSSFEEIFSLKILILGNASVGKTSILIRFIQDLFNNEITTTLSVNSLFKQITVRNQIIKLNFIDVPGNYCKSTNLMLFLRNSDGFVIVIDSQEDKEKICQSIEKWEKVMDEFLDAAADGYLIFNKCESGSSRIEEIEKVLDMFSIRRQRIMKRFYVSAKEGEGICEAFQEIVLNLLKVKTRSKRSSITLTKEKHLNLSIEKSKKKCC